jgi:hypothetical protein
MVSDVTVETMYWRQGVRVAWPSGFACIESASGQWGIKDGILITVADGGKDFAWLGFFVDQLDSLIYQWYPGQ